MKSDKFLEQVAEYYARSQRCGDLANLVFVMPNKRSAMFLKRYIQQRVDGEAVFMPKFMTFGRLVAIESQLAEVGHNDKLFMLYSAYRRVLERNGRSEQARDFDKFVFWGDMILDDFDLIDQSLASPEKLYKNLKNLKEITADYLTDEQKSVINKFWGETPLTAHVDSFWMHTAGGDVENTSLTVQKFISLWQILAEVYEQFRYDLESKRLATSGMQMKQAVKMFKEMPLEKLRRRQYVFVGHADLSLAELSIMERLNDVGCADFFWDVASPQFKQEVDNKVYKIIKRLAKQFPMPDDFELKQIYNDGEIDILGVASNVGQAKMAASIIYQMSDECRLTPEEAINTAIVVPDTSLLMPLMLGMPDPKQYKDSRIGRLDGVNVTMSLPFTSTTIATLFRVIISMHMRARKRRDRWTYFYQDVLEVLAHPHIQLIEPDNCDALKLKIRRDRLYNVDAEELIISFPSISYIFKPVYNPLDIDEVYGYIIGLLKGLRCALQPKLAEAEINMSIETQIIDYFEQSVEELYNLVKVYDISMSESTFFAMFERILASKKMSLSGSPLKGVQVMGVLETRALDFDNIIFLSMNERTFPRRNYVKTMIPNNLRHGFGLPTIEMSESYYSYYFYRAISRAKSVRLLYDSRAHGGGSGEMSRYVTQLIYSNLSQKITHNVVSADSDLPNSRTIVVDKTPEVLAALEDYKHLGTKRISASALKTYMQCPLAFYLQYVRGIRDDDEPMEYLTPAVLGTVFHNTVRWLYEKYKGQVITAEMIDEMIKGPRLRDTLRKELSKEGYNSDTPIPDDEMTAEALMNMYMIEKQIQYMLDVEKNTYLDNGSFIYYGGEVDVIDKLWEIVPGLKINFRMQIDRIDKLSNDCMRFIDYKTGSDECNINSIEGLFVGNSKKMAIFQLLLYAEAYNDLVQSGLTIIPAIHQLRNIARDHTIEPTTIGKEQLSYPLSSKEFRPLLNNLVYEIFDASVPFEQTKNIKDCAYCKFVHMCGRNLPEN